MLLLIGILEIRMEAAVPRQRSLTEPFVDILGEVEIAGRPAMVTWPQAGDAVGIDFADPPARFGVVVSLDRDPRLLVEPEHADLLDVEERLLILEAVGAMWYGSRVRFSGLLWVEGARR